MVVTQYSFPQIPLQLQYTEVNTESALAPNLASIVSTHNYTASE